MPGRPLEITNRVLLASSTLVYTVEQTVLAGWIVDGIAHGGVHDVVSSKVKWGPFSDRVARLLRFNATPRLGTLGTVRFDGIGSFDGREVAITGAIESRVILSTVTASMPERFQSGVPFTVNLEANPSLETRVYAIEDQPPRNPI